MDNSVDKCVENGVMALGKANGTAAWGDSDMVICRFLISFPRIFDGKRYKLSKFAPKKEIVDKRRTGQEVSELISTVDVERRISQRDKLLCKKKAGKF